MASVSLSTLARFGFDEPEAAAKDLERLGAWPPAAAAGGARLLADVAASAAPHLAARSLAALAAAHPDPEGFTALLRRRPGFRRRLVPVVAASRSLGGWLATHPTEADRLADGHGFATPRPRDELVAEALGEHVFEYFLRNKHRDWNSYQRYVSPFERERYLPLL